MVDQAKVNSMSGADGAPRPESAPGAMARSAGELLHDVVTLSELQARLLVADAREGVTHLVTPIVIIAIGLLVILGCIPVAFITLALLLVETTTLTAVQAYGVSLLSGLVFGAALAAGGYWYLRHGSPVFERTQIEWRQNMKWAKDAIGRITKSTKRQTTPQY